MDTYQGDLNDIVGATGVGGVVFGSGTRTSDATVLSDRYWNFCTHHPMNFSAVLEDPSREIFADPSLNTRLNPFLHHLHASPSSLYNVSDSVSSEIARTCTATDVEDSTGFGIYVSRTNCGAGVLAQNINTDDEMKKPCNLVSEMIPISSSNTKGPFSPCDPPAMAAYLRGSRPPAMVSSSKTSLVDKTAVQISSPRNPGLKRKYQTKKVVLISAPAPAAPSNQRAGEVVPADLWAWRKYGQKPIKGSPYPRGYYRCSSSKVCSAKKQVERSKTDPNVLVISYTFEHNHPSPTQRNSLAGSSNSQPSKNRHNVQERQHQSHDQNDDLFPVAAGGNPNPTSASVEEEINGTGKQLEIVKDDEESSDGFASRQSTVLASKQPEDIFSGFGEIEADPLINLLFSNEGVHADDELMEVKGRSLFNLFD